MTQILRTVSPVDEFDHGLTGVANVTKFGVLYSDSDATNVIAKAAANSITLATGYLAGYSPPSGGSVIDGTVAVGTEIAYAETPGGTAHANMANVTFADVTNCQIAIPASVKPVVIEASALVILNAVPAGGRAVAYVAIVDVASGAVFYAFDTYTFLPNHASGDWGHIRIRRRLPASLLASGLSLKLTQAGLLSGGGTIWLDNGATVAYEPSWIRAVTAS